MSDDNIKIDDVTDPENIGNIISISIDELAENLRKMCEVKQAADL